MKNWKSMKNDGKLTTPVVIACISFSVLLAGFLWWLVIGSAQIATPYRFVSNMLSNMMQDPSIRHLEELPRANLTSNQAQKAISNVSLFRVGEMNSSMRWMTTQPDGSIETTGFFDAELTTNATKKGENRQFRFLYVPETVAGVTIYHAIPLFSVGHPSLSAIQQTPNESTEDDEVDEKRLFRVRFKIQDGWLEVTKYQDTGIDFVEDDFWNSYLYPNISEFQLTEDFEKVPHYNNNLWMDVQAGSETTVRGFGDGEVLSIDTPIDRAYGMVNITVPDQLGLAVIYHIVQPRYLNKKSIPSGDVIDTDEEIIEIEICLVNGVVAVVPNEK
jgi:hypothetical protein